MSKLEKLISECPCEVQMERTEHMPSSGYFQHPSVKIFVAFDVSKAELFAVLCHEIGHANCYLCHCPCFRGEHNWRREYHAYIAMLKGCMNYIKALREAIRHIEGNATRDDYPNHRKACRKLMKTRLWRKACKVAINFSKSKGE